jgi:hypothetical protein
MLLGATLAAAGISNLGWAAAPLTAGGLVIVMLILALFLFDGLRGDLCALIREKRFIPGWKRPGLTQDSEVAPMTGDSANATSR